jgi:alanine-synthesizing transaminase
MRRGDSQDLRDILKTAGRAVRWLGTPGWRVEKPRGSMFVWAPRPERYRALGSLEFSKLLLERALVAVSPGIGFGPQGEGRVRFALVENEHRIQQATRSIGKFLRT